MILLPNTPLEDSAALKLAIIETALPAHLLWMASQALNVGGFTLRQDIQRNLNRSAASALSPLKTQRDVQEVASRVDFVGRAVISKTNPSDPVGAFYAVCMMALILVDEGLFADADNMAILVALACINDLKEEGQSEGFAFREKLLSAQAYGLLDEARRQGLYRIVKTGSSGANSLQPAG